MTNHPFPEDAQSPNNQSPDDMEPEHIDITTTRTSELSQVELLAAKKFPEKQDGVPMIGVWGMTKSGKTTFMVSLYWVLAQRHASYRWSMVGCNKVSRVWAFERISDMWFRGLFPVETSRLTTRLYTFDLKRRGAADDALPELKFAFLDAPGEDLRVPLGLESSDGGGDTAVDYLDRCDAVIMLLDPLLGNRLDDFQQFVNMLGELYERNNNKKLTKPMLFVITKCDLPRFRDALANTESAFNLLEQQFPPQLPGIIADYVENPMIYAASSIGFETGKPPNLFPRYDGLLGIREPRKIRPRNVAEAFEALALRIIQQKMSKV